MPKPKPKMNPPPALLIEWCPYLGQLGHFTTSQHPAECSYDPAERFRHVPVLYVRAELPERWKGRAYHTHQTSAQMDRAARGLRRKPGKR